MRVVYFGSGEFSVPSLRAVLDSPHEVVGIYTQPARPAGRGARLTPTPVARQARGVWREVVECADINAPEVVADLRARQADILCVVDFGQLIRPAVMASARRGAMNLHGSLLPALRGAAPINWALIRGCRRTGVTTFRIVEQMDAGPIYYQVGTDIGPEEAADELSARLAALGAEAVCHTLDLLADGRAEAKEQDHSKATFAPKMKKADGVIDWSADAEAIGNLIRGTWPWPGGQARLHRAAGGDVAVALARATPAEGDARDEPGVLDAELCVSTGRGRLRIAELQPSGKRRMAWRDFVNGYRLRAGDRFTNERP